MFEMICALLALTVLEIILGIDNLVILAVLTDQLPKQERQSARSWGLLFAWVTRLLLLGAAFWIVKLSTPFMILLGQPLSIRGLFLMIGGVFLMLKATQEIHQTITHQASANPSRKKKHPAFWMVVLQVGLMDIIFSFDSVLTAIGLTNQFWIMTLAITCAIIIMIFASKGVAELIEAYPTLKMLALSFLMLIGVFLIAEGVSFHIPRGYIYFAMGFSFMVEGLNLMGKTRQSTHDS